MSVKDHFQPAHGDRWEARQRARQWLADADDVVEDDLVELADEACLDAARRVDPRAGLSAWLDLRFSGPRVRAGALDLDTAAAIFGPFQAEVRAAATGRDNEETRLELVGVSEGSTVLHVQPVGLADVPEDSQGIVTSRLDGAISQVFSLHDAVERGAEAADVADHKAELLQKFRSLVHKLDFYDLNLELYWNAALGRHRRSALTERGRAQARELFEQQEEIASDVLTGTVYELSLRGELSLRVHRNGREATVKITGVAPDLLQSEKIKLGSSVVVNVMAERKKDRVGRQLSEVFRFVSFGSGVH